MNRAAVRQALTDPAKLWDGEYLAALEKWISDTASVGGGRWRLCSSGEQGRVSAALAAISTGCWV